MANRRFKVAMIGCGGNMRWAHLPFVKSAKDVELVAVADPNAAAAETLVKESGSAATIYADYRKLLAAHDLDAVLISTPHAQHHAQVRAALDRGLHVLVEKPFTIKSTHAATLLELASKKKRMLMVAYQRNYADSYRYARQLVESGRIGDVVGAVSYITQRWTGGGWRGDPKLSGGGFMMDTGSHLVAATLYLIGSAPVEVRAWIDNHGQKYDVTTLMNIRFENSAYAALSFFARPRRHDERISLHGSEGTLVLDSHEWKGSTLLVDGVPEVIPPDVKGDAPAERFFDWLRTGGKGYAPPLIAADVARVSEAAYRSAQTGKPVSLKKRAARR